MGLSIKLCLQTNNGMHFVLPDTGHMFYLQEEDVVYRKRYCGVIYDPCDVCGVEEDDFTIFLADTLIQKRSSCWNSSFSSIAK